MKLTPIDKEKLPALLAGSPFSYDRLVYERGRFTLEELTPEPEFLYVHGGVIDEYPGEEWHTRGRSSWNPDKIRITAERTAEILTVLGANGFYIQHKSCPVPWFSEEDIKDSRAASKIGLLRRHGVDVDLTSWVGGFLLEGNPVPFLKEFLDYSHLLRRNEVEMICRNLPLMLGLDWYLFAYWVSSDRNLLSRVTDELARRGVLLDPSPYLPPPNVPPEQSAA
jgi:hypothetical protein